MCNRWATDYASFLMCDVKIMHNPNGNYIVNGKLKSHLSSIASNGLIKYWASNPPTHSFSYVGSECHTLMKMLHLKIHQIKV